MHGHVLDGVTVGRGHAVIAKTHLAGLRKDAPQKDAASTGPDFCERDHISMAEQVTAFLEKRATALS
jgi:hypothetical protein